MGGGWVCHMWDECIAVDIYCNCSDLVTSAATHGGAHISSPSMSPTSYSALLLLLLLLYSAGRWTPHCIMSIVVSNMGSWAHLQSRNTTLPLLSFAHKHIIAAVNGFNIYFSRKWDLMISWKPDSLISSLGVVVNWNETTCVLTTLYWYFLCCVVHLNI